MISALIIIAITMKTKSLHLIYIPFTDVGIGTQFRNDEWLAYRIKIFKDYTLKSLVNQTNKDFILWLSFTEKENGNPLLIELSKTLNDKKIKHIFNIFTFDGLMYHDDKFGGNIFEKAKNFLRIMRRCNRNKRWNEFVPLVKEWRKNEKKNETLKDRLNLSLNILYTSGIERTDWVYLTRLDSDDMLNRDFVKIIHTVIPKIGAVCLKNGYCYNKDTDELAHWQPATNPPFHTIMFPADIFFNAERHLNYYGNFKSHEDIPRIFPPVYLKDGLYCVLVHSRENQISTIWNHKFRGGIIEENKKEILNGFGL